MSVFFMLAHLVIALLEGTGSLYHLLLTNQIPNPLISSSTQDMKASSVLSAIHRA